MTKVSVSILSNSIKPEVIVEEVIRSNADYIHLDIMDGEFVSNKTWDFNEVKEILKNNNKELDVHFMVSDPLKYIKEYSNLNVNSFTFHLESTKNVVEVIDYIKSINVRVGISIKPSTNISEIYQYLKSIDEVLIMSVEPGASGQSFIDDTVNRIRELNEEIIKQDVNVIISVDGGINDVTGKMCAKAGASKLVSASYVHKDVIRNIDVLKNL